MTEELYDLKDRIKFAEVLNTRFCHDMAGAVSACYNGMEFMLECTDNKEMYNQAVDLLRSSSGEALSKLQTYRMKYGRTNNVTCHKVKEIRRILINYYQSSRVDFDWTDEQVTNLGEEIDETARRILVNMVGIVASSIPYGGRISLQCSNSQKKDGSGIYITVVANADRIRENEELARILGGEKGIELTPFNIPNHLMYAISSIAGIKLDYQENEVGIRFSADFSNRIPDKDHVSRYIVEVD